MTKVLKYELKNDLEISFENENLILYFDIQSAEKLNINLKDGKYDVVINFNNSSALNFKNIINATENAEISTTFISLCDVDLSQVTDFNIGVDSSLKLVSSYYVKSNKKVILNCYNKGLRSHVDMDNSCIVAENGNLYMDVVGKIFHKASGSSSHQKTRCLTVGDVKNAKVNPLLLIDENDVEASHAMALGTIDSEQLFYMQTRGLNYNQCISLLFESYLMPNLEHINDEEFKDFISEIVKKRLVLNA